MSTKLSRSDVLDDISGWDTEEVLCLLRKNGLEECCKAVAKRQIDGDELLHLTDGKLALWKSDLTRPLIGKLWVFVQELNKTPEKYIPNKTTIETPQNDDHLSDSGSWGTDFEDEASEEPNLPFENIPETIVKPSQIKNRQAFLQNNKIISKIPTRPSKIIKPEEEETYANCESCQDEENTYANFHETKSQPMKNVSRLHSQIEKTLAEKLKEELKRRHDQPMKKLTISQKSTVGQKPIISPKPETLSSKKIPTTASDKKLPQQSFLHNAPKTYQHVTNETQRRMTVPPPPEPKRNKEYSSVVTKKLDNELPKPPATIRNFDLVANLPARTEESEDEYEQFDENIIEQMQNKEISRVDSKQSLHSGRQGSIESVYKPPSATSYEEEEEDYEIYEYITEAPEDNDYERPIQRTNNIQEPPPLPAKLPSTPPPSIPPNRFRLEKFKERSPDKKSATLPHTSNSNSLSTDRATRPLPPPPERQSYVDKPWFHNVTREQATALIKDQSTYNNPQDGYFLLRPSTTHPGNPLALVLWYRDRVYNVSVRKRNDNRYALGSPKMNEQSFSTIEEIVSFYMREELVLHTGGVQTGSTKLTDTPLK